MGVGGRGRNGEEVQSLPTILVPCLRILPNTSHPLMGGEKDLGLSPCLGETSRPAAQPQCQWGPKKAQKTWPSVQRLFTISGSPK